MNRRPMPTLHSATTCRLDPGACEELCRVGVEELEPLRREALWRRLHTVIVLVFTLACTLLLLSTMQVPLAIGVGAVGLVATVAFGAMDGQAQGRYSAAFNEWRSRALRTIHPDAHLEPGSYLPHEAFDSTGINQEYYNRYSGDTLLRVGTITASNLRVTHVYTESGTGKDDRDRTEVDNVFTGVLVQGKVRMPYSGWVVLLPRSRRIPRELTSTQVISPELNRSYSIGANDPFVAHRILDPSKQSAVWEFASSFRQLPRIAYKDDVLTVGLDDMILEMGRRPTLFRPVAVGDLENVIQRCEEGIGLITDTVNSLAPETLENETTGRR